VTDETRRQQIQLLVVTQQRNQALDDLARVTAQLVVLQEQLQAAKPQEGAGNG
jgi:hypothetical protein